MEDISIMQFLYVVLIVFLVIIGTLLSIILLKINKILRVFTEMSNGYFNIKNVAMNYSSVPKEIGKKFMGIVKEEIEREEEAETVVKKKGKKTKSK